MFSRRASSPVVAAAGTTTTAASEQPLRAIAIVNDDYNPSGSSGDKQPIALGSSPLDSAIETLAPPTTMMLPQVRMDLSLKDSIGTIMVSLRAVEQSFAELAAQMSGVATKMHDVSGRLVAMEAQFSALAATVEDTRQKVDAQNRRHEEQEKISQEYRKIREFSLLKKNSQFTPAPFSQSHAVTKFGP